MNGGQNLLQLILGVITAVAERHLTEHRLHQERLAAMREAIEQVVDASEPRIRLVGNYAEKLLDPVETALRYSEELLRQMPPALALSDRAWSQNPQVNAFFATAADLRTFLSENQGIRAFFAQHPRSTACFALLLMIKQELETFGMGLQGELIARDTRQIQISFSEHGLFFPATSEAGLRQELKRRLLLFLATRALELINGIRAQRGALEEQYRQLQAQLRALKMYSQGPRPLLSSADTDERRVVGLERRLAQTEEDLVAARRQLGTLDDYLEQVRQVLSRPNSYLQVQVQSIKISRLGVKLSPLSTEPGETITLLEFSSLGERRIGVLAHFTRHDLSADSES